jgi:hypothetical protein
MILRNIFGLFFMLLITSCLSSNNERETKTSRQDTRKPLKIRVSDGPDIQTVVQELSMYNETYVLNLIKYKHRNKPDTGHEYLDSVRVTLRKDEEQLFSKRIDITTCLDSLSKWHYDNPSMTSVAYSGVRSNRLYFDFDASELNGENPVSFEFAIFFQTKKTGRLDYWKAN